MEPSSKKRRLAPKADELEGGEQSTETSSFDFQGQPAPTEAPQPPQASQDQADLERFARHLQDAALNIDAQATVSRYAGVNAILLQWEDDPTVADDMTALQKLFRERYGYRVETYAIPSVADPAAKVLPQVTQNLQGSKDGQLSIIYYKGYTYVGPDNILYWACHSGEESSRLQWSGIKSLIDETAGDVLVLLDAGAVQETGTSTNGVKQVIAACEPGTPAREPGAETFTYHLIDAFHKLSSGPPFTTQQLHAETVASLRMYKFGDQNGLANGADKDAQNLEKTPLFISLTAPENTQEILLSPLIAAPVVPEVTAADEELLSRFGQPEKPAFEPSLMLEDTRALVSLPFHTDPDQELASFKIWLSGIPEAATRVSVEGKFVGAPGNPTIMLISMPIDVFNAIAAEKQCALLGYIKTHNVTQTFQNLIETSPLQGQISTKHLEDGKILLEAAEAAQSSPGLGRHEGLLLGNPNMAYQHAQQAAHALSQIPVAPMGMSVPPEGVPGEHKEDSDEMHEAAIQLKALSHVRPHSHNSHRQGSLSNAGFDEPPRYPSPRRGSLSSQEGRDNSMMAVEDHYSSEYNTPTARPSKANRRSVSKSGQKQDTRCSMCSHAPFKDSSSLRKHVAAAHTRPFPCAFAFAGCTSTFGSKNEWKRHIASQHLCLTYYRCSSCPQSTAEGKGNEFNRKDLFTQHLRRMHAPFAIKKAIAKGDSRLQQEWESHVKEMQQSCLVVRRSPPQRSACPKPDCQSFFEGAGSWDDWTEHVGRHMEKGEADRLGVDRLLARWALEEGIIERVGESQYRLSGSEGRDSSNSNNLAAASNTAALSTEYYGDGNGLGQRDVGPDPGLSNDVKMEEAQMAMADDLLRQT